MTILMLLRIHVMNPIHIENNSPIYYDKQHQLAKIIYDLLNFNTIYEKVIKEYQLDKFSLHNLSARLISELNNCLQGKYFIFCPSLPVHNYRTSWACLYQKQNR